MRKLGALMAFTALAGCNFAPGAFDAPTQNAALLQGPPIEDVVTSFDKALTCLRGKIQPGIIFAVGQVVDATGKETYADGGSGKFVTQGAGEMVQSALFRAGVSVVNRRDPNISITEANWGIRDITRQMPVNFYVSGSINSLDFIPGGGASVQIAGIGPRLRQSRILVALDLTMTDAFTGRVVANIPLQKQIYTREFGGSANTFFGDTLVQLDAGGMEREAMHFALRQMLNLATLELFGQLMNQDAYAQCRAKVEGTSGQITSHGTADRIALNEAVRAMHQSQPQALEVPVSKSDAAPAQVAVPGAAAPSPPRNAVPPSMPAGPREQPAGISTEALAKGRQASTAATQAIRVARDSQAAQTRKDAVEKAAEALQLSNYALILLREAAELGFNGDEGEIAAVVVQQALKAAQEAGTAAAQRQSDAKTEAAKDAAGATAAAAPVAAPSGPGTTPAPEATSDPGTPTASGVPTVPPPGGPIEDRRMMGGR